MRRFHHSYFLPAANAVAASAIATALIVAASLFPHYSLAADAGVVQRCEAADGKVTYSNGPCPEGAVPVRSLPADAAPTSADKKAAQERTLKAKKILDAEERAEEKRRQQSQREKNALDSKAQARARDCGKLSLKVRFAREDLDRAAFAKRPEYERKLARAQESYDKSCKSPS